MIQNGKDIKLGIASASLPNVSGAMINWFRPMTFGIICKTQIDGFTQEIVTNYCTKGVRQPFTAEQLAIKPEGERSWKWEQLHCLPDLKLKTDSIVLIDCRRYRVMALLDYAEYGYLEYHIIEDYADAS